MLPRSFVDERGILIVAAQLDAATRDALSRAGASVLRSAAVMLVCPCQGLSALPTSQPNLC